MPVLDPVPVAADGLVRSREATRSLLRPLQPSRVGQQHHAPAVARCYNLQAPADSQLLHYKSKQGEPYELLQSGQAIWLNSSDNTSRFYGQKVSRAS